MPAAREMRIGVASAALGSWWIRGVHVEFGLEESTSKAFPVALPGYPCCVFLFSNLVGMIGALNVVYGSQEKEDFRSEVLNGFYSYDGFSL